MISNNTYGTLTHNTIYIHTYTSQNHKKITIIKPGGQPVYFFITPFRKFTCLYSFIKKTFINLEKIWIAIITRKYNYKFKVPVPVSYTHLDVYKRQRLY